MTTQTTPWAHLPNVQHIDWALADLKQNPEVWGAAQGAAWAAAWDAARGAAWAAAWAAAWDAARGATRDAARAATRDAARDAAWDAAQGAAWGAARGAAWAATLALIAYDDCAYMLELQPDVLRAMYKLTDEPAAILLLPAAIVRSEK